MDTPVVGHVLVLFMLMAAGFLSYKLKVTTKESSAQFSSFVMKITLPCMTFNSFRRPFSWEIMGEAAAALGVSIDICGFAYLLSLVYPRLLGLKGPERGVHRYALIVSNCGLIGFPMVNIILGPNYIFHAVIFTIPFSIMAFSGAAWLIAKEGNKAPALSWKSLITAPLVATLIGLIAFIFSIPLPEVLETSIKYIGDVSTPLSMAVIGMTIAQTDLLQLLGRWRVYITVFMRLLLLPAFVGLACYIAHIRGPLLILSVIITGMPAGSTTSILAAVYEVAEGEASSIVALSTILCALTLPLVVIVVYYFAA